jgi:aminopeptidase N
MLTRAGLSDATDALNLMAGLPQEDQPLVVMSAIDILRQIDTLERGEATQSSFRAYARMLLSPILRRVGWDRQFAESPKVTEMRGVLIAALGEFQDETVLAEANQRFMAFRDQSAKLPADIRDAVLEVMGRNADEKTYNDLLQLAQSTQSSDVRKDILKALASVQNLELLDRTIALTEFPSAHTDDSVILLITASQRSDADRVWVDVKRDRTKVMGGKAPSGLLTAIAEHAIDESTAQDVESDASFVGSAALAIREIRSHAKLRCTITPQLKEWLAR